jgi:hypothetical protein
MKKTERKMSFPPPGYDDSTVAATQRLKLLLGQLENELNKIQSVFYQHLPNQFHVPVKVEREFWLFRHSADELGADYSFLVEKLISDYEHFRDLPDQEKLDQIFRDVKSLQLLLVG